MLDIISRPLTAHQVAKISEQYQAYTDAHAAVSLGDDRHQAVIDYYEDRDETHQWLEQPAGYEKVIGLRYGELFGVPATFADIEEPAWATQYEDAYSYNEVGPGRHYRRTIIEKDGLSIRLEQYLVADLEKQVLRMEPVQMIVDLEGADPFDITSPEQALEVAVGLQIAGETWRALTAADGAE